MPKYIKLSIWFLLTIVILFSLLFIVGKFFVVDLDTNPVVSENTTSKNDNLRVGEEAPYFNLSKISGGSVNRADIKGVPSILVFWATWNSASADQIKILDDYIAHAKGFPVRIITISSQENISTVSSFVRRGDYNIEVLLDQTGELGNQYGIQTLPTAFFIDKDGIIREIFIGVMSESMIREKIEGII